MAFTKRELSPRPESKRAELDVSGPDSLRSTSNQLRVMLNPAGCDLDGLVPEQGCEPWASALDDGNAIMGPKSSDISDCEVMMMVGLPASGKTTWAEKWAEEYPEKRFVLLGRNLILDEMKCHGVIPHRACASSVPRNNCGCSWSSGSISGGRADSCQNYGFVGPYGRANTVGENSVVGAAATPKPYWSNMAEPFTGGAARTSSFTCDNVGGLPCGTPRIPLPASLAPSPRSPYSNFPTGMQQHSGGYKPPPQRNCQLPYSLAIHSSRPRRSYFQTKDWKSRRPSSGSC
ncbi:hypothetical protein Peur_016515 [Populus x canadensis]